MPTTNFPFFGTICMVGPLPVAAPPKPEPLAFLIHPSWLHHPEAQAMLVGMCAEGSMVYVMCDNDGLTPLGKYLGEH